MEFQNMRNKGGLSGNNTDYSAKKLKVKSSLTKENTMNELKVKVTRSQEK